MHIGLLIMAAMAYLAPQFIKEGRLCWLRAPLYVVTNRGQETYYFTDQEMDSARGALKGTVTRNKGLGEMMPETARNSMFNPVNQRMDVMEYDDVAMSLLYELMGEDTEPRRNFIFNNIDFSQVRE